MAYVYFGEFSSLYELCQPECVVLTCKWVRIFQKLKYYIDWNDKLNVKHVISDFRTDRSVLSGKLWPF